MTNLKPRKNSNSQSNNLNNSSNNPNSQSNNGGNLSNNSNNQNNHPIGRSDNPIVTLIHFLWSSVQSSQIFKRSLMLIGLISLPAWSVLLMYLLVVQPNKVSLGGIKFEKGLLTKEEENEKSFYMSLSPNGDIDSAWVNNDIEVKKGQKIKINAAGKINVSLAGLVESAEDDVEAKVPWNDPDGLRSKDDEDAWYQGAKEYRTMPKQPFGKLIAAIKSEDGTYQYEPIGKNREFIAEKDGKLLLTVNDIWLYPRNRNAYLPPNPTTTNRLYYRNKVLNSIPQDREDAEQVTKKWKHEKWDEEINKYFKKREKRWITILEQKNHSLWYDDNVGTFSVTMTIR